MRVQNYIRSNSPLTDDQIFSVAPSVFAAEAHASRSARYTYLPTIDVLRGLRAEGFEVYSASQSRTRDVTRREFTKHMLRLRRGDAMTKIGDEAPEIVMVNSHDGTSAYDLLGGVFRLACLNGMVVPASLIDSVKVYHKGDVRTDVIEGVFSIVGEFDRIDASMSRMKAIDLRPAEQSALADAAIVAKYGKNDQGAYPVTAAQVLTPRRYDDNRSDLWTTFNRVQENMIRGGLRTRSANGRRMRTREVTGISQNVQLNQALWTLAEQMATIKEAA